MKNLSSRLSQLCLVLGALIALHACAEVDPAPDFGTACTEQADCGGVLQCIQLTSNVRPACTTPCNDAVDCPSDMVCGSTNQGQFCAPPGLLPVALPNNDTANNDTANNGATNNDQPTNNDPGNNDQPTNNDQPINNDPGNNDRPTNNDQPEGCQEDAGCQEGQICQDGVCVEGCRQDEDCQGAQLCQEARCVSVEDPACQDSLEPNDAPQEAQPLVQGQWSGLRLCPGEPDWYSLTVQPLEVVEASVSLGDQSPEVDLALIQADGDGVLVTGTRHPGGSDLTWTSDRSGVVFLRALGAQPEQDVASYTLAVTRSLGEAAPDCADGFEPNDQPQVAAELRAGTYTNLGLCPEEDAEDWFAVQLTRGQRVTARALFAHADADLGMHLWGPGGLELLDQGQSQDDDEQVSAEAQEDGLHLLQVSWLSGGAASYTLDVDIEAPQPGPCQDIYEENNAPAQAAALPPGVYSSLTLCGDDGDSEDWFRLEGLREGQTVRARVTFDHDASDIDLHLLGVDAMRRLDSSVGVSDQEEVEADIDTSGTYFLRVFTTTGQRNPYTLELEVVGGSDDPLCNDRYEPNGDRLSAPALEVPGQHRGLGLCSGFDSEDWYALDLEAGQQIQIQVTFTDSVSDIDAQLLRPTSGWLDWSQSSSDDELLEDTVEETGTHYLRIYTYGGDPNPYDIDITLE